MEEKGKVAERGGPLAVLGRIDEFCDKEVVERVGRNWARKRVREFRAGRSLARALLCKVGLSPVEIAVSGDRVPIWPPGIVGSISHSDEFAFAAVGSAERFRGIGVDTEAEKVVSRDLWSYLFLKEEITAIERCEADATELFCCKEAIYKSVFPFLRERFEFQDVVVNPQGNRFRARFRAKKMRSAREVESGNGWIFRIEGQVATVFTIRLTEE